ncbi:MAG: hypothetical protein DI586_04030 [Micavibrio aeruginosavorus]|uniref:Uncharacterized protein n=1 Tax=Micavibrio aeruginosavorus TaxID=349221 RepID=A0A2W5FPL7_9BACT|nr:MAG: hypothetical protein DI586_04030 [Micavibrio aeruginosavorus]
MTDVTPLLKAGQKIIQSYASGKFKISGVYYEHPVIITALDVQDWNGASLENLSPDTFLNLKDEIDVLIIGSGKTGALLMPQKRIEFKEAGFSVEIMDTGAACRTFNVLTAEGRRVAAALLPV